jgi:phosphoglycolate phosphatase-like HAD superfamily hydrolase
MQKIRVVITDADGTVFGGVRRAIAVFCRLLAARGVKITPHLWHEAALQWGSKLEALRVEFFPHLEEDALREIYDEMRPHATVFPFPGMRETFSLLHDCGISLNMQTSRTSVDARRALGKNGLREYLTRLICLEDVGYAKAKPSPCGLNMILEELRRHGVSRDEAVYVGDSLHADLPCAAAADIPFVAVCEERLIPRQVWMAHGLREENILSSFRDLPAWLGLYPGSRLRLA